MVATDWGKAGQTVNPVYEYTLEQDRERGRGARTDFYTPTPSPERLRF